MTQEEIEDRTKWACGRKLKLNMEEAAERCGNKPNDVLLYLCSNCNFLHFGHKPRWEMTPDEVFEKRRVKETAEYRRKLIAHKRLMAASNVSHSFLARAAGKRSQQSNWK